MSIYLKINTLCTIHGVHIVHENIYPNYLTISFRLKYVLIPVLVTQIAKKNN